MKLTEGRRPSGTGCVYQRPDSQVWWLKYSRHGKSFRESSRTTEKRKAEKMLLGRMAEIKTGTFAGLKIEKIKVQELADDLLREYRINGRKSLDDLQTRWNLHLGPFFGYMKAMDVTTQQIAIYIDARQHEEASNATINRELAALKRMFRIGSQSTPAKVLRIPTIKLLKENNVRKGFLEDEMFHSLVSDAELWFRALVECGRTYGWRVSELLGLKVEQIDLVQKVIRLEPGTTKNSDGREVFMTDTVRSLLSACVEGKATSTEVFTRPDSSPVRDFRVTWERACSRVGVGKTVCADCSSRMESGLSCTKCKGKRSLYTGLIFHDLRRTAARNLRRAGIPETVIMKIGGWKTRSVFERYAIVSRTDIADAMKKLQQSEQATQTQISHELVTNPITTSQTLQ